MIVGQPVEWEVSENGASCESTTNFINPSIVESVPGWALVHRDMGRLDVGPERAIMHVLPRADWVDRPSTLSSSDE